MRDLCLATTLLATIYLLLSMASQAQLAAPDYRRSWFVPALTENHDSICPTICAGIDRFTASGARGLAG
jgi:hypothetical protein